MFLAISLNSSIKSISGFVFLNIVSRTINKLSVAGESLEKEEAAFTYKKHRIVIQLKTQPERGLEIYV